MLRNVLRRSGASSTITPVVWLCLTVAAPLQSTILAQQPDSAGAAPRDSLASSRDSLEERLRRAEEASELLRRQLAPDAAAPAPRAPRASSRASLGERLRRAEEAIELLRRQLATQASSEVRTRS